MHVSAAPLYKGHRLIQHSICGAVVESLSFVRRLLIKKKLFVKAKPSAAMTTAKGDKQVAVNSDQLTEQTAALKVDDGKYDPDTVTSEVATFALD